MTDAERIQQIQKEIAQENQEPVIPFTLEPGEPELCESKVGGTPYLPHGMPWPVDMAGLPMTLLAQVNCTSLAGLPDFPQSGLLQFFIGLTDTFGADFDNITKPGNFQVLYHETADPSVTAEEVRAKRPAIPEGIDSQYLSPLCQTCRICFKPLAIQGMTDCDRLFEELFCQKWNALCPDAPIQNTWDLSGAWGDWEDEEEEDEKPNHQMGGYPSFTQWDPRMRGKYPELDVLLFQLDSDGYASGQDMVLWGDCGIANFFINREDLKKRDFSNVGYNWDCC